MPGVIMLDANDNQGWVAKIKAADCHLCRRKRWALEKIKSPPPITDFYREPVTSAHYSLLQRAIPSQTLPWPQAKQAVEIKSKSHLLFLRGLLWEWLPALASSSSGFQSTHSFALHEADSKGAQLLCLWQILQSSEWGN